jgi:hypothetical protein
VATKYLVCDERNSDIKTTGDLVRQFRLLAPLEVDQFLLDQNQVREGHFSIQYPEIGDMQWQFKHRLYPVTGLSFGNTRLLIENSTDDIRVLLFDRNESLTDAIGAVRELGRQLNKRVFTFSTTGESFEGFGSAGGYITVLPVKGGSVDRKFASSPWMVEAADRV